MQDLKPGDIIAVHGTRLISKLIADATGAITHVGIVTSCEPVLVTQALATVQTLTLTDTLTRVKFAYAIQPLTLSDAERQVICDYVISKLGEGYDYADIALQGLNVVFKTDWFTNEGASNSKVICSELVAQAYARVGKMFGESRRAATPSQIFDFALQHPSSYAMIKLK